MSHPVAAEVDARGLKCPLPILKTKKALAALASAEVLRVLATDPSAAGDFAAFCRQTGHALLSEHETNGEFNFLIQKR
ncbi:MAG: sulfurtransferase TusA family protein [Burkholderiaceae bacterium]|jgi:tRNA 2-thiouridine synthesizing protein A